MDAPIKLGQYAEKSWRKLRSFAHLADVIKDVNFINGTKPQPSRCVMIAWTPDSTIARYELELGMNWSSV